MENWKGFQTITLTHTYKSAFVNIALNVFPGGSYGPDPQGPVPVTQLQPDVRGLLQNVPDYHSYPSQKHCFTEHSPNFVLVNIALYLFPWGSDVPDPQVPFPVTQLHPDVHGQLEGVPNYHFSPSQ